MSSPISRTPHFPNDARTSSRFRSPNHILDCVNGERSRKILQNANDFNPLTSKSGEPNPSFRPHFRSHPPMAILCDHVTMQRRNKHRSAARKSRVIKHWAEYLTLSRGEGPPSDVQLQVRDHRLSR